MEPEKNKWVEEVLDSTAGMEPARSATDIFKQIMTAARKQPVKVVSLSALSAAAACLLILLSLNFFAIRGHERAQEQEAPAQSLAEYYDFGTSNPLGL